MEGKELLEKYEKLNYNSKVNKIWIWIIFIAAIFLVYKIVENANIAVEKLNDEKMELSQKLYEYKKNTVIQNKDVLTSYLTQHFKEMKEYRVISLIQSNNTIVRVILDEPIKTTENNLGYKKSNWIDVITIVEPGKLEIKDFFPIILKEETKSEPKVVDKNSWLYKIQEFFPNQFSELLIFFSESSVKIDKMITDMNIDSIENPILLVKIGKSMSFDGINTPVKSISDNSMSKGAYDLWKKDLDVKKGIMNDLSLNTKRFFCANSESKELEKQVLDYLISQDTNFYKDHKDAVDKLPAQLIYSTTKQNISCPGDYIVTGTCGEWKCSKEPKEDEINLYKEKNCANLEKDKNETKLQYDERIKTCLVVAYTMSAKDLLLETKGNK